MLFIKHDLKNVKLSDIAKIRSGLVLSRKQARQKTSFTYPLLTLQAIQTDGTISQRELRTFCAVEELQPDYLTHTGDIIIRLTSPYTAVLIDTDTAGIVVSSNFIIIRADTEQVQPEYLAWLLNTSQFHRNIYRASTSNMLEAVTTSFFSTAEIMLPSSETQQKITRIRQLAGQECRLLRELAEKKESYYNTLIEQILSGKEISRMEEHNDYQK